MADEEVAKKSVVYPFRYVRITLVEKADEDAKSLTLATDYIEDDEDVKALRNSVGSFAQLTKYMGSLEARDAEEQLKNLQAKIADANKKMAAIKARQKQ